MKEKTMIKTIIIFISIVSIFTSFLSAHEDHNKKKESPRYDTLTIVNDDTIAINGIPTDDVKLFSIERGSKHNIFVEKIADVKTITLGSAFEHIHNKVIHFPIALSVVGFLLMLFGYKDGKYLSTVKIIIPFAAIMGIVAILSGQAQIAPFEGTSALDLVKIHELLGFGVVLSLILWSLTLYIKKLNNIAWLLAMVTIILVSITGLYGGVIAH
jgi:uncharacterized membrane protein